MVTDVQSQSSVRCFTWVTSSSSPRNSVKEIKIQEQSSSNNSIKLLFNMQRARSQPCMVQEGSCEQMLQTGNMYIHGLMFPL